MKEVIYVLDFGSQYSHLIVRRIRELAIFAELVPYNAQINILKEAKGIILSGGPQNLSGKSSIRLSKEVYNLGMPILGICYGLQLIAYDFGGKIIATKKREYGPTKIFINQASALFKGLSKKQQTWMSHGDQVVKLPSGFDSLAFSDNAQHVAIANPAKKIYGLQFHPEVSHTVHGTAMLANFIKITGAKKNLVNEKFCQ